MDDLLCGRLCLATMSLGMSKLALTIAVRFSNLRKSFGPTAKSDTHIMSYGSQLRSLATRLAQVYAMQAGVGASTLTTRAARCFCCLALQDVAFVWVFAWLP